MCGIAGFTGSGDREVIGRMTSALRHRGPDGEGISHDATEALWLGHRRLSIVDLEGGVQPMWTRDGALGVVFNGEIYNHLELRAELVAAGRVFESDHSDTEVLLHGYAEWGAAMVERLEGMWAFVIFDKVRRRLFASRDRFGKKPFFYHLASDGTFAFASELKALQQHPAVPRSVSVVAVQKYFAYCHIPAPMTLVEGVWKLPGGHSLEFDLATRALRIMPYWRFTLERDETLLDPARWPDLCEELRVALEQAVRRRLMSDVPLGVFLSGGVDSSAIAALAARHVPLQTFAVGFSEPTFDETAWARRAAEHIGSEHRTETLALEETPGIAEDLLAGLDEPVADSSILPTALLCRFTRRHVTVALGGDGGDELFAGYDPFRALRPASLYQRWMPRPFHGAVRSLAGLLPVSHTNLSFDFKLKRTLAGLGYPPPLWNPVWMSALEPEEIAQRTGKPAFVEMLYAEAFAAWERCESPHIVDKSLCYWTDIYLRDGILSKVDRASMLASLEARSPFLDRAVVEIARRIPWELKLRGSVTKWILKEALEPILPPEIVHRAKKGFGMPVGRWFRDGRLDLRHTDSGDFSKTRLAAHRAGARDDRLYLWAEWLLERRGVA